MDGFAKFSWALTAGGFSIIMWPNILDSIRGENPPRTRPQLQNYDKRPYSNAEKLAYDNGLMFGRFTGLIGAFPMMLGVFGLAEVYFGEG